MDSSTARRAFFWPKGVRLLKRSQFLALRTSAKTASTKSFLVVARPNSREHSRFGITISKKVDKRAVYRNRLKRRLREVLRRVQQQMATPHDVHVIGRLSAGERNFQEIQREMLQAFQRLRILPRQ